MSKSKVLKVLEARVTAMRTCLWIFCGMHRRRSLAFVESVADGPSRSITANFDSPKRKQGSKEVTKQKE